MPDELLNDEAGAELEARIDEAMRRVPAVAPPPFFRERLLARLPAETPAGPHELRWLIAGAVLFAGFGGMLYWTGEIRPVVDILLRPAVLVAAAGVETCLAVLWLWRVSIAGK